LLRIMPSLPSLLPFPPTVTHYLFHHIHHYAELLLGPTFATSKVLQNMNLTLADIGVVEFHEAFAGTKLLLWMLYLLGDMYCRSPLALQSLSAL
jgi:hypothetical protein